VTGVLHVVATPIGNLDDLAPRARECLHQADEIFAEDTRHTRKLLSHLGIRGRLFSLHQHNEKARAARVVEAVRAGKRVALVSDAGTPAISDPGAAVVRAVVEAGLVVLPVPGPSALAAVLSVSGFAAAGTAVLFVGFLPVKGRQRREAMARVLEHDGVVVLYESPHRLRTTLSELAGHQPHRAACIGRELTKLFEEVRHGSIAELSAWATENEPRGELSLVLAPVVRPVASVDEAAVDAALHRCLDAGLSPRDASTAVAATLELPRRTVYQRCQQLTR
jgi:16S rRNA (cytidine1402-2'-O)-methyltransferase